MASWSRALSSSTASACTAALAAVLAKRSLEIPGWCQAGWQVTQYQYPVQVTTVCIAYITSSASSSFSMLHTVSFHLHYLSNMNTNSTSRCFCWIITASTVVFRTLSLRIWPGNWVYRKWFLACVLGSLRNRDNDYQQDMKKGMWRSKKSLGNGRLFANWEVAEETIRFQWQGIWWLPGRPSVWFSTRVLQHRMWWLGYSLDDSRSDFLREQICLEQSRSGWQLLSVLAKLQTGHLCPPVASQLWPRVLDGGEDHMMQNVAIVLAWVPLRIHVEVIDHRMFLWKSWWRKQSSGSGRKVRGSRSVMAGKVPGGGAWGVTLVQTYRGALGRAYVTSQHCLSWARSTLELGLWLRAGLMHGFPSFLVQAS